MTRDYGAIQRVLAITFALNLAAAVAKLAVGLWSGALSLVADGLDTLFDGISNIVGLLAVRVSSRPPDKEHPYGHRKYETLAALFIAAALLITAWEVGRTAVDRLLTGASLSVNRWSIAALILGGLLQAATGIWERRKARQLESEVLLADARHTLASIGVSATVLAGLGAVALGYDWADPLVALAVALFIAKVGVDTVRENIPALVDRAPLAEENIGAVVASVEGVASYHRIRSRGPADNVAIDLHVRVAPNLTMQDANAIADEVRRRLLALPGVGDVTVHAEAQRDVDSAADLYTSTKLAAQELGIALHECWVHSVDHQLSLHLHVGVDPNLSLNEAHALVDQLEETLLERRPELNSIHSHIELANMEILPTARVSSGLQQRIYDAISQAAATVPGLTDLHNIQVRQVEGKLFISLEALVNGDLSVTEAHELSTRLQEAIRAAVPNVSEVLVHLEPHSALPDPSEQPAA
ncbi:MAG TPA: cation diffusion facilitator family transporter [Caldilineaceae bacterium]|nr:cation diffusion facilitator family transporter [Caldilineaceae bacterium]